MQATFKETTAPIDEVRARFDAYLKDLPDLLKAVHAVLDKVAELDGEPLHLGEATQAAGVAFGEEGTGLVMAAISHLSQGREPALELRFLFKDAAGEMHRIENADREKAAAGEFPHPVTGEMLTIGEDNLYPQWEPLPGLLPPPAPRP